MGRKEKGRRDTDKNCASQSIACLVDLILEPCILHNYKIALKRAMPKNKSKSETNNFAY